MSSFCSYRCRPGHITFNCLLRLLLAVTDSHTQPFRIFADLDSFEEYWAGISQNVPPLGFVCCLSHDQTRVISFGSKPTNSHFHHIILKAGAFNMTDVGLDYRSEQAHTRSVRCEGVLPPPFPTMRKSLPQLTLKEVEKYTSFLWGRSLYIK